MTIDEAREQYEAAEEAVRATHSHLWTVEAALFHAGRQYADVLGIAPGIRFHHNRTNWQVSRRPNEVETWMSGNRIMCEPLTKSGGRHNGKSMASFSLRTIIEALASQTEVTA